MNRLIIIGAGGHGRVVADIARLNGYNDIRFLDDSDISVSGGYHVVGKVDEYVKYTDNSDFIVAIGNNKVRRNILETVQKNGANIVTLIHPAAVIAENVNIGKGSVVMSGAVVNCGTVIGVGVIINTCSSVDHDCIVEDYVHISVGSHLAGTVKIGECTMIGAGATVINNISICENCVIGAGAVVVKNIKEKGTYVGVPAKKVI